MDQDFAAASLTSLLCCEVAAPAPPCHRNSPQVLPKLGSSLLKAILALTAEQAPTLPKNTSQSSLKNTFQLPPIDTCCCDLHRALCVKAVSQPLPTLLSGQLSANNTNAVGRACFSSNASSRAVSRELEDPPPQSNRRRTMQRQKK